MTHYRYSSRASLLALGLMLALPGAASAQDAASAEADAAAPGQADAAQDAIVVTGSRIARAGFTAPTPVTVLGMDRLQNSAASSVGDAIQQLPSVLPTVSATTAGVTIGAGGYRTIDLRGLGAPRTLVLVDGRRFIGSTSQGTVDTNLIPGILVDRVEVVTGGASAAYGSDAVAGVVNFILNKKLDGIRLNFQSGISQAGDDHDVLLSGAAGTSFADGRGHAIFGVEYADNRGVGNCYREPMPNRRFCQEEWQVLSNTTPGVNGYPAYYTTDNVHTGLLAQGGVINSGPLRGNQFNAAGELVPFTYGILQGLFMGGGSGEYENPFRTAGVIKVPVERIATFGHVDFDFTDHLSGFAEASFGRVNVITSGSQIRDTGLVIQRSNPFLTPATVDRMTALDLQTLTVGRAGDDLGFATGDTTVETWRATAGLEGRISDRLKWDVYYQYGRTDFSQAVSNNRIGANFTRAIDAARDPVTNEIVCRATLSADPAVRAAAQGCVPLNIIGANRFSPEAKAYSFGTALQDTKLEQHVVAANLSGSLVDLWAGPVSFAVGAEHRQDSISGTTDPISQKLGFYVSNGTAFTAPAVKVTEGYLEGLVPLLNDAPLARHLELNGAVRYTDYSTSGGVTTWKVGATWDLNDWFRLRGTRSRDIRAPNLLELFGSTTSASSRVVDETGVQWLPRVFTGGNDQLRPETADTWTIGAVFSPKWGALNGLRLSVDYYDIQIDDAISQVGGQTIVDRCFADRSSSFCDLVTFGTTNTAEIVEVRNPWLNLNTLIVRGIDIEGDYRLRLADAQSLSFRVLASYVKDYITVDSVGAIDRAGQTGVQTGALPGMPRWTVNGTISYDSGPFNFNMQGRYIGAGIMDVTLVGPTDAGYSTDLPNSISDNHIEAMFYLDVGASYTFELADERKLQIFGAIKNLTNPSPPVNVYSGSGTNPFLFDMVGRRFTIGARVSL